MRGTELWNKKRGYFSTLPSHAAAAFRKYQCQNLGTLTINHAKTLLTLDVRISWNQGIDAEIPPMILNPMIILDKKSSSGQSLETTGTTIVQKLKYMKIIPA